MNAPVDLAARVQAYLAERRQLGFGMRTPSHALPSFARFVQAAKHTGPLRVELMAQWARQAQGGKASAATAARKLAALRPFLGWLQQFGALAPKRCGTADGVPRDALWANERHVAEAVLHWLTRQAQR